MRDINWAGFYMLSHNHLLLGPFMGKPACIQIAMGNGVCGKAAAIEKTCIVPDVNSFPGHIACDNASKSEIVIPLVKRDVLYGVMDVDSPILDRFQISDKEGLEEIAELLLEASDMESVLQYYNR